MRHCFKRGSREETRAGKGHPVEAWAGVWRAVDGRVRSSGRDQGQGDHCG